MSYDYAVGMRVEHHTFGPGEVSAVTHMPQCDAVIVEFDDGRVRRIVENIRPHLVPIPRDDK